MDAERRRSLEETTRYDPGEAEARVLAGWLEEGHFHPEAAGSPADNYSIAIPPPNVTRALHMGHALNAAIQDALIRFHRMLGQRTKWILGTDHAWVATQRQSEKQLEAADTTRVQLGPKAVGERAWRWRE